MSDTNKNRKIRMNKLVYLIQNNFLLSIIIAAVVVAMIVSGLIIALKSQSDKEKEETKTTLEKSDSINLAMYEPRNFNVYESNDEDVFYINEIVYSSLFKLDKNLNIINDAVANYSADSENGQVYITLRDDIKFSDGSEFESADVKASIEKIKSVGERSPYFAYTNKIDSIDVVDSKHFTLFFKSPSDAALDNLTFPIVSAGEYKAGQQHAIGSGPYAYSTFDSGKTLILSPNKYFFGKKAKGPIVFSLVKDQSKIPGLMTMDAVTAFLDKRPDADSEAQDKKLSYKKIASGELEYLGFNLERPYCKENIFRIAIAKAIDNKQIIKYNYAGAAISSDSIFYPELFGTSKDDTLKFEPQNATKLLKRIKLKDMDEDGKIENENGENVRLQILVLNTNKQRLEAAKTIVSNLEKIGIESELISADSDEFSRRIKSKEFDIYFAGIKIDRQFNLVDLYTTYNNIGFNNTGLLSEIYGLEKCLSGPEQKKYFSKIKKNVNEDASYIPVCYKAYWFLSVETLENADKINFFSPYAYCQEWDWAKRKTEQTK